MDLAPSFVEIANSARALLLVGCWCAGGPSACRPMEDVKEGKDYNFPTEETDILRLWDEINAFKEQLRRTEGQKKYSFYDGPPFATGLPHYGHLLAGTIKVPFTLHCLAC